MHYTILWGHGDREDILKHLIYKIADLNMPDVYGRTPLHYAIALCGRSIPLREMILGAGGSLDIEGRLGHRPVNIAIVHTRMENYQMLTQNTENLLSEVRHGRRRR